jgi:hypothetical protein
MNDKYEGNLVSFRLFINTSGDILSEYSYFPEEDVSKVFPDSEAHLMKKVIKEGRSRLETLHDFIEKEVQNLI